MNGLDLNLKLVDIAVNGSLDPILRKLQTTKQITPEEFNLLLTWEGACHWINNNNIAKIVVNPLAEGQHIAEDDDGNISIISNADNSTSFYNKDYVNIANDYMDIPKGYVEIPSVIQEIELLPLAELVGIKLCFSNCYFTDLDGSNLTFSQELVFKSCYFAGNFIFHNTIFSDVQFVSSEFAGQADFWNAEFSGSKTSFTNCKFSGSKANFWNSRFIGGEVSFRKTQFLGVVAEFWNAEFSGGMVSFNNVKFKDAMANFRKAKFSGGMADFSEAEFCGGDAEFADTIFSGGDAKFWHSSFSGSKARFWQATFSGGRADFWKANFCCQKTDFGNAEFSGGKAVFWECKFKSQTIFNGAIFEYKSKFSETEFLSENNDISFRNARFNGGFYLNEAIFASPPDFRHITLAEDLAMHYIVVKEGVSSNAPDIEYKWRQLKRLATIAECYEKEREFCAYELETRAKNSKSGFYSFFTQIYKIISNYGRSIRRPIYGMLLCLLVAISINYGLKYFDKTNYANINNKQFCFGSLPCVNYSITKDIQENSEFRHIVVYSISQMVPFNSMNKYIISQVQPTEFMSVLGIVFSCVYLLMLFFLGLAIRNRFRV